jgi:hypothetical protein
VFVRTLLVENTLGFAVGHMVKVLQRGVVGSGEKHCSSSWVADMEKGQREDEIDWEVPGYWDSGF